MQLENGSDSPTPTSYGPAPAAQLYAPFSSVLTPASERVTRPMVASHGHSSALRGGATDRDGDDEEDQSSAPLLHSPPIDAARAHDRNFPLNWYTRLVTGLQRVASDIAAAHKREILPAKRPREYTALEEAQMQCYESVDTHEPETTLFRDHLETKSHEPRWFLWVLVLMVGTLAGSITALVVSCLHVLNSVRYELLGFGLRHFDFYDDNRYPCNHTASAEDNATEACRPGYLDVPSMLRGESVGLYGISAEPISYGYGYVMYVSFSVGCMAVACLVSYAVPRSIGSGVPEVMAYMNGVSVAVLSDALVLVAKILVIVFTVASGVCTGYYGPLVLVGAMIASQTLSRRRWIQCYNVNFVNCFRNPRDRRVVTVMGAAAGFACALCAPISGLLFVVELLSSVLPTRFAMYAFVACLVSTLLLQVYFSYMAYFNVRDRSFSSASTAAAPGFLPGEFITEMVLLFHSHVAVGDHVKANIFLLFPAVLLGVVGGWLAAQFIRLNWLAVVLRRRLEGVMGTATVRFLVPVFFTAVYATIQFWAAAAVRVEDTCVDVPETIHLTRARSSIAFYGLNGYLCGGKNETFLAVVGAVNTTTDSVTQSMTAIHGFASLAWGHADSVVQTLLSIRTPDTLSAGVLLVFGVGYFIFSALYAGVALCSDTLLPPLVIGGVMGRLCGLLLLAAAELLGIRAAVTSWADPGVFALIGAGCFLSGTSGLTLTVGAMLMETTSYFQCFLPLMVGVMVARKTAERYTHDLHTMLLEMRCVPLLDYEWRIHKYAMYCAAHVMHAPVVTLGSVPTLEEVVDVLKSTTHNGFPIVSVRDGTYKGIVTRTQLEHFLWHMYFTGRDTPASYEVFTQRLQDRLFHEGLLHRLPVFDAARTKDMRLDLSACIDHSGFTALQSTTLPRVYEEFRTLGLRHLTVVDDSNYIVGIITRKDLVAGRMLACVRRVNEERRRRLASIQQQQRLREDRASGGGDTSSSAHLQRRRVLAAGDTLDTWLVYDADADLARRAREAAEELLRTAALHPSVTDAATAFRQEDDAR